MSTSKRSVLITGCSSGGMGAALAIALHEAGLHVYATARDPAKMEDLKSRGIETLTLDVQSSSSIADAVAKLSESGLDILINNAGATSPMPISDVNIDEAKKIFDLNVWSNVAMTQAFLPLLMKSPNAMIVNHTSVGSQVNVPFQAVYTSSKAAMAMMSDALRLELEPFGIKVIDLKTGVVKTNFIKNMQQTKQPSLPKDSIYSKAKDTVERVLRQESFSDRGMPADQWAKLVVGDLLKTNPPPIIWRGEQAWGSWLATTLPFGSLDSTMKRLAGLDVVASVVRRQ